MALHHAISMAKVPADHSKIDKIPLQSLRVVDTIKKTLNEERNPNG